MTIIKQYLQIFTDFFCNNTWDFIIGIAVFLTLFYTIKSFKYTKKNFLEEKNRQYESEIKDLNILLAKLKIKLDSYFYPIIKQSAKTFPNGNGIKELILKIKTYIEYSSSIEKNLKDQTIEYINSINENFSNSVNMLDGFIFIDGTLNNLSEYQRKIKNNAYNFNENKEKIESIYKEIKRLLILK